MSWKDTIETVTPTVSPLLLHLVELEQDAINAWWVEPLIPLISGEQFCLIIEEDQIEEDQSND